MKQSNPRLRKRRMPMGLIFLMGLAAVVVLFGASFAGEGILGGVLIGAGVILVGVVAARMARDGVYADLEYYQLATSDHEQCECPACRHERGESESEAEALLRARLDESVRARLDERESERERTRLDERESERASEE